MSYEPLPNLSDVLPWRLICSLNSVNLTGSKAIWLRFLVKVLVDICEPNHSTNVQDRYISLASSCLFVFLTFRLLRSSVCPSTDILKYVMRLPASRPFPDKTNVHVHWPVAAQWSFCWDHLGIGLPVHPIELVFCWFEGSFIDLPCSIPIIDSLVWPYHIVSITRDSLVQDVRAASLRRTRSIQINQQQRSSNVALGVHMVNSWDSVTNRLAIWNRQDICTIVWVTLKVEIWIRWSTLETNITNVGLKHHFL